MRKNVLARILVLGIAVSLVTACAAPAEPTPAAEPATAAPAATQAPDTGATAPAEAEEPASTGIDYSPYAGTELVFLRHSGYDADWMATQAAQFYEETGIKVTVEQIAYSEMHNKIVVDVSSEGGVYDMFATTNYWLPEFYDGGWVIDQQQYLDNPALYNSDFQLDDVSQSLLDANRIDGALLAMPWKFNSQFLYYRTDLLDAAPTNWDEMLEAAQANTNDSTVGISLALSKTSIMDVYLNLLYQNGGTLLSEDLKTCNLDSDEAREALEYLIELSQYTTDGAINNHWDETAAIFAQGGAAMAPVVNTQVGNVVSPDKSMVSDSVGFAELPGKVTSAAASNTWGIAITRNSKNPEAAFLFIQYLMQPDHIKELVAATEGSTIPVRGSLLTDADFSTSYPWFDVMNAIATTPGHAYAYPMSTQTTAIMEVLAGHVQNAIIGAETVDDALNNAKAEIEALL